MLIGGRGALAAGIAAALSTTLASVLAWADTTPAPTPATQPSPTPLPGRAPGEPVEASRPEPEDATHATWEELFRREPEFPRWWFGVTAAIDLHVVPGAPDVCKLDVNASPTTAYRCLDPNTNKPFPSSEMMGSLVNRLITLGNDDRVASSLQTGSVPLSVSVDYAATANLLVGARLGYEALTIPTGGVFPPLRVEGRVTTLLGKDAIRTRFATLLLAGVGVGEFDASVPVQVHLTVPTGASSTVRENAWITAGPLFAEIGAGGRFLLAHRLALTLALTLRAAVGGTAGVLIGGAPEVGVQVGF